MATPILSQPRHGGGKAEGNWMNGEEGSPARRSLNHYKKFTPSPQVPLGKVLRLPEVPVVRVFTLVMCLLHRMLEWIETTKVTPVRAWKTAEGKTLIEKHILGKADSRNKRVSNL